MRNQYKEICAYSIEEAVKRLEEKIEEEINSMPSLLISRIGIENLKYWTFVSSHTLPGRYKTSYIFVRPKWIYEMIEEKKKAKLNSIVKGIKNDKT
jgi:hypothetical protein